MITEDEVFTAVRAFILNILPTIGPDNVRQGQQNSVPMPLGPNFVIMTPGDRGPLATTVREYRPDNEMRDTTRSTQFGLQLDFYGPEATDNGQVFSILFRDMYGCDFLRPYDVQPLYTDSGRQMPLTNSELQYETRWMIRTVLQINPTVSTTQDFADTVAVVILEAD